MNIPNEDVGKNLSEITYYKKTKNKLIKVTGKQKKGP